MANNNSFQEVTNQSWGSRIMASIKGVAIGGLFFIASFPVLFWNEGRAVRTAKSLKEGASNVIETKSDMPSADNEGKLVHVTGNTTVKNKITDAEFGISIMGIKLIREVEGYQWKEKSESKTRDKVGGGQETITTYSYERVWSTEVYDSDKFKSPEGHINPKEFIYNSKEYINDSVQLGGFQLSSSLINAMNNAEQIPIQRLDSTSNESVKNNAIVHESMVYIGSKNIATPQIGDLRIKFKVVKPATVSIISKQIGNTFEPYEADAGDAIELLEYGKISSKNMFTHAQDTNRMMTWILRLCGFVGMFIGLTLIFKPLVMVANVLPFLGSILNLGIGLFAGIIAFTLSILTIAIAWLFYRPVLSILLLAVGVGLFILIKRYSKKKKSTPAQPKS